VCPRQLQNVYGKYFSLEGENVVRLYEFIPGKILCDVPPSPNLYYHAGVYLGKLDETLKVYSLFIIKTFKLSIVTWFQNFNHDGYTNFKTLWMLSSISHLDEYISIVNEGQRGMVETILEQFKQKVLENIDQFAQQTIHGDFNEQNILVGKSSGNSEYKVTGVIDFGDTQRNCLLFELAIALSYIMLTTGEIETGGYFLAGYKMTRLIPEHEMQVLKVTFK
jgi:hydroxylysine kinase